MVAVRLFVQGCVAPPALMTGGYARTFSQTQSFQDMVHDFSLPPRQAAQGIVTQDWYATKDSSRTESP